MAFRRELTAVKQQLLLFRAEQQKLKQPFTGATAPVSAASVADGSVDSNGDFLSFLGRAHPRLLRLKPRLLDKLLQTAFLEVQQQQQPKQQQQQKHQKHYSDSILPSSAGKVSSQEASEVNTGAGSPAEDRAAAEDERGTVVEKGDTETERVRCLLGKLGKQDGFQQPMNSSLNALYSTQTRQREQRQQQKRFSSTRVDSDKQLRSTNGVDIRLLEEEAAEQQDGKQRVEQEEQQGLKRRRRLTVELAAAAVYRRSLSLLQQRQQELDLQQLELAQQQQHQEELAISAAVEPLLPPPALSLKSCPGLPANLKREIHHRVILPFLFSALCERQSSQQQRQPATAIHTTTTTTSSSASALAATPAAPVTATNTGEAETTPAEGGRATTVVVETPIPAEGGGELHFSRGILICGPTGVGKTRLALAIVGELSRLVSLSFFPLSLSSVSQNDFSLLNPELLSSIAASSVINNNHTCSSSSSSGTIVGKTTRSSIQHIVQQGSLVDASSNSTGGGVSGTNTDSSSVSGTYNSTFSSSEQFLSAVFAAAKKRAPSAVLLEDIAFVVQQQQYRNISSSNGTANRAGAAGADFDTAGNSFCRALAREMDALRGHDVIVLATCETTSAMVGGLRRSGRFDSELCMPLPDSEARKAILQLLLRQMPISSSVDIDRLVDATVGCVAADLHALLKEAFYCAVASALEKESSNNSFSPIKTDVVKSAGTLKEAGSDKYICGGATDENPSVVASNAADLAVERVLASGRERWLSSGNIMLGDCAIEHALLSFVPTYKQIGNFLPRPTVRWSEVGGLHEAKREVEERILFPLTFATFYDQMGIKKPTGILLYGPPGCGKTYLAKALANACQANFIAVKGPELLSKYVGESEASLRSLFSRASFYSPSLIFFDEIDALCGRRNSSNGGDATGNKVEERVVAQLLTELDGICERGKVFVVAATNRPDMLDPALLRPGRLEIRVYVQLPSFTERRDILEKGWRRMQRERAENRRKTFLKRNFQSQPFPNDIAEATAEAATPSPLQQGQTTIAAAANSTEADEDQFRAEESGLDFEELARKTEFFSGADLDAVLREAVLLLIQEQRRDFFSALHASLNDENMQAFSGHVDSSRLLLHSKSDSKSSSISKSQCLTDVGGDREKNGPEREFFPASNVLQRWQQQQKSKKSNTRCFYEASSLHRMQLQQHHLLAAARKVIPSVSFEQIAFYEKYREQLAADQSLRG